MRVQALAMSTRDQDAVLALICAGVACALIVYLFVTSTKKPSPPVHRPSRCPDCLGTGIWRQLTSAGRWSHSWCRRCGTGRPS